jgi:MFS family permease
VLGFLTFHTQQTFYSLLDLFDALANADLIDIGPSYAGALMGISNTVATLPGIAANLLAGEMLASTNGDWRPVFGTAVAVLFAGLVAFLALAQGHPVLVPSTDASLRAPKGSNEDQEE